MIALLQRVSQAQWSSMARVTGAIDRGLMVLVCAERGDTEAQADASAGQAARLPRVRRRGRQDEPERGAGRRRLLLVPQFTLAADTRSGTRPSFTPAAAPEDGRRLFDHFVAQARRLHPVVQTGVFGADMQVSLTNDGPVTFWLQTKPAN
jgi:D-tyrosyl-tRNA(Tyr) deacylase